MVVVTTVAVAHYLLAVAHYLLTNARKFTAVGKCNYRVTGYLQSAKEPACKLVEI